MNSYANPELAEQYAKTAVSLENDACADDDVVDRMIEEGGDDSYMSYLRMRAEHCRMLARNARETAEYFREG